MIVEKNSWGCAHATANVCSTVANQPDTCCRPGGEAKLGQLWGYCHKAQWEQTDGCAPKAAPSISSEHSSLCEPAERKLLVFLFVFMCLCLYGRCKDILHSQISKDQMTIVCVLRKAILVVRNPQRIHLTQQLPSA